jgi:hypothetical protein
MGVISAAPCIKNIYFPQCTEIDNCSALFRLMKHKHLNKRVTHDVYKRLIKFNVFYVESRISLLHIVQTAFGAHPASYPMGTGSSFSGGKVSRT